MFWILIPPAVPFPCMILLCSAMKRIILPFMKMLMTKTVCMLEQFLKGYQRHRSLSREEKEAILDLLAVYHFQLQATIIEIYGPDCVDDEFLDNQLDWLYRWKAQCASRAVEP